MAHAAAEPNRGKIVLTVPQEPSRRREGGVLAARLVTQYDRTPAQNAWRVPKRNCTPLASGRSTRWATAT